MAKLIAVTGNGNAGKTVFSFYLAQALSAQKKKIVLVSTDSLSPTCKMLFPSKDISSERSLGKLLSLVVITDADVFNNTVVVDDNLMMLSYAQGESHLNYPDITDFNLQNLFHRLNSIADVVIVDTTTHRNKIDQFFLENHARQICLTTADEKGCSYRNFYNPDDANAIEVLFNYSSYNPIADVVNTLPLSVKYSILPYCKCLTGIYNGIDITSIAPSRRYRKILDKVAGDVL